MKRRLLTTASCNQNRRRDATLFGRVAAPGPDQCVGEGLVPDFAVAVAGLEAVHETVIVAGGFEGFGGAFAGHDPVVMGVFGVVFAEVVFGNVVENAERFSGRVGD